MTRKPVSVATTKRARAKAVQSTRMVKATVHLSDTVLAAQCFKSIPYETVDQALSTVDRTRRQLRKFSDHLVVYFCILMAFFMESSYLHVFERLKQTFDWLCGFPIPDISDEAIVQARQRVTSAPMKALFQLVAKPLATHDTPGAFFHNLRLTVIDGSTFDVADSPANAELGKVTNQSGKSAFPLVRAVALIEWATRAVIDLACGPYVGSSELSLARIIIERMPSGLLCLGDRNFPGTDLCRLVTERGSHFVWRVKRVFKLKPIKRLADGSFLAYLTDSVDNPLVVRVIEYKLRGGKETYRIVTSILESTDGGAEELARLYHCRWGVETFIGEIKTDLRAPQILLRSKHPDTVYQELYGMFLAHYVVRAFMFEAAQKAGIPSDHLSFKHAVHVIRTHLPKAGSFSPS